MAYYLYRKTDVNMTLPLSQDFLSIVFMAGSNPSMGRLFGAILNGELNELESLTLRAQCFRALGDQTAEDALLTTVDEERACLVRDLIRNPKPYPEGPDTAVTALMVSATVQHLKAALAARSSERVLVLSLTRSITRDMARLAASKLADDTAEMLSGLLLSFANKLIEIDLGKMPGGYVDRVSYEQVIASGEFLSVTSMIKAVTEECRGKCDTLYQESFPTLPKPPIFLFN